MRSWQPTRSPVWSAAAALSRIACSRAASSGPAGLGEVLRARAGAVDVGTGGGVEGDGHGRCSCRGRWRWRSGRCAATPACAASGGRRIRAVHGFVSVGTTGLADLLRGGPGGSGGADGPGGGGVRARPAAADERRDRRAAVRVGAHGRDARLVGAAQARRAATAERSPRSGPPETALGDQRGADVRRPNGRLPALRAELIGRADLVAVVSAQLQQARLTTLIGPGGVGKTSVALAVAHHDVDRWPEGAVFVDLVPARTAGDVLRALADALGVEGDASRSDAELGAYLADRSMLIVVDNCEHVIDAAAELVDVALGLRRHVAHPGHQPRTPRAPRRAPGPRRAARRRRRRAVRRTGPPARTTRRLGRVGPADRRPLRPPRRAAAGGRAGGRAGAPLEPRPS